MNQIFNSFFQVQLAHENTDDVDDIQKEADQILQNFLIKKASKLKIPLQELDKKGTSSRKKDVNEVQIDTGGCLRCCTQAFQVWFFMVMRALCCTNTAEYETLRSDENIDDNDYTDEEAEEARQNYMSVENARNEIFRSLKIRMICILWPNRDTILDQIYKILIYNAESPAKCPEINLLLVNFIQAIKRSFDNEKYKAIYCKFLVLIILQFAHLGKQSKDNHKPVILKDKEQTIEYINRTKKVIEEDDVDYPTELTWFRTVIIFFNWGEPGVNCKKQGDGTTAWMCSSTCQQTSSCHGYHLWKYWKICKLYVATMCFSFYTGLYL